MKIDGELPKSPKWSVTFSPQYSFDAAAGSFTLRADYSYRSKIYNDIDNSPEVAQEPYHLLHARLGFTPPSGRWELALFGTNLTDEEYLEHGIFVLSLGNAVGISGRPREWGLAVGFRF